MELDTNIPSKPVVSRVFSNGSFQASVQCAHFCNTMKEKQFVNLKLHGQEDLGT